MKTIKVQKDCVVDRRNIAKIKQREIALSVTSIDALNGNESGFINFTLGIEDCQLSLEFFGTCLLKEKKQDLFYVDRIELDVDLAEEELKNINKELQEKFSHGDVICAKVYEIAEKYILDLERDFENYADISKAFASICEFKIDSNSYFGEKNDFLGEEAQKIMKMFKNETGNQIKLIFSTDEGKNYILVDNNLVEIMINQHSLKIEDGHIEIQSYLYELQDFVEQLEKVEEFFSETVKLAFSKLKKINE